MLQLLNAATGWPTQPPVQWETDLFPEGKVAKAGH